VNGGKPQLRLARRMTHSTRILHLLGGLLQGIGRLYILSDQRHRALFAPQEELPGHRQDWHLRIAAALLGNWELPTKSCRAVHGRRILNVTRRGP